MALTVWKYEIPIVDEFTLRMPAQAKPLYVNVQSDTTFLWALVNPDNKVVDHHFRLAGTGHPIDNNPAELAYVGTILLLEGTLLFHLFDLGE